MACRRFSQKPNEHFFLLYCPEILETWNPNFKFQVFSGLSKLRYYEMATKFEKISHSCFYSVASKQVGYFFKFLWPFQKSWTLKASPRVKIFSQFEGSTLFCTSIGLSGRRQEPVEKSSGSHQSVVMQSKTSFQAVVKKSTGSFKTIARQFSRRQAVFNRPVTR